MSARIKYAYLKDQTWIFRRNYPEAVAFPPSANGHRRTPTDAGFCPLNGGQRRGFGGDR
ncbi:hypothetical protein [Octadecabacter ascidiaceicola]|uniref:Uncharacterized protein n=1 Tax=Octadecabacter ascidiaceicola TaxID=1655543 RepID=A0A238KQA4_9RHOB|nr:hypothetical protein [Octadecabacter ascidiaceicola]SMX44847.1 hypothetical protein OCA8868_03238 [Octadecabacter ascidiaceicola]